MPNEYEFMKTKDDKEMPEEEFQGLYKEYSRQAEKISRIIQIFIISAIAALLASYVLMVIVDAKNKIYPNFHWLAIEFIIIAVFLYDPKVEEDKRYQYETDKKILLKSIKNKIKLNKIRFAFVIFFSSVFAMLNGVIWYINIFMKATGL